MSTNIEMYRGDSQAIAAVVSLAGVPQDISGSQLRFTAKRKITDADADAVIVKTSGDGIELVGGGTAGACVISLEPEDTELLDKTTTLLWDLQVTDGLGDVYTTADGRLKIVADVSRTSP